MFEVVFEVRKDTFIAELSLIDADLHLIRFYSQVSSILDIFFANELLVVVGDTEMMGIQHSISQYLLRHYLYDNTWQKKSFFSTYGIKHVEMPYFLNVTSSSLSYLVMTS
jgi:hypothetical protein